MEWEAYSPDVLDQKVREALGRNLRFSDHPVLGVPASFLDRKIFSPDEASQRSAFLTLFLENPNHIGCHTMGASEALFAGTHALELDALRICAEGLLNAETGEWDGYIASGGTESNIQAAWTFRNALRRAHGLRSEEVGLLFSEDTHYSAYKAANLLDLTACPVAVGEDDRKITPEAAREAIARAERAGVKAFIVFLNMGTTMFGSVDHPESLLGAVESSKLPYYAHVDAAFGGFIYPLTNPDNPLDFRDPRISSFTLDAHKLAQAPYGTGVHIIRKGLIEYVHTEKAEYVPGGDSTLCGSRSGANAISVWMILRAYGSVGARAFCQTLIERTERLCAGLDALEVEYFREPGMNIVTMRAAQIPEAIAERYVLVPDNHEGGAKWRKAIVMDHVGDERIDAFLRDLGAARG